MSGVQVEIELADELLRRLSAPDSTLQAQAAAGLSELASRLGVPAPERVHVGPARSPRAVRLLVDGHIAPSSLATLRRTWLACSPPSLHDLPLVDPDSATGLRDNWLKLYAGSGGPDGNQDGARVLAAYLSRLAVETLSLHPELLMRPAAAAAYVDPASEIFSPEEAATVLRELLELGISLPLAETIRPLALGCRASGGTLEAVIEEIFGRLARQTIDVEVNPEWLADGSSDVPAGMTVRLGPGGPRSGLASIGRAVKLGLAELGVTREIVLSTAPDLAPGYVRIRINARQGLPIPVARPGEIAVQDPPSTLTRHGIQGRLLIDAASGHQLVALPSSEGALVEQQGRTPLSAELYLVVAIVREITAFADRLIDITDIEHDLADLEGSHPELVHAALRQQSRVRLTRVCRGLLAEQVSIRDMWLLLNALLRYEAVAVPGPGLRLFDTRVAVADPEAPVQEVPISDLTAFVRLQVKGQLVWGNGLPGGHRRTLDAYAIDENLETALRRRAARMEWSEEEGDSLRRAIGRALAQAGSAADAVLLVPASVRVALHDALAVEFPSLRVLARTELPAETSVNIREVIGLA